MEKKFLVTGMIVTSAFIFAFSSNNIDRKGIKKKFIPQVVSISAGEKTITDLRLPTDTIPAKPSGRNNEFSGKINTTVNGKKYTIVTENNKVYELYVNGKKIPSEKMGEYKTVTDKLLKQAKSDLEHSDREWEEAALGMAQSKKDMEQYKLELEKAGVEMEQSQKEMKRDMEQAKIDMEQYQKEASKEMEHAKMEIEQSKRDMMQYKIDKEMQIEMKQAKIEMEQYQKQMIQSKKEMEQANIEMAKAKKEMEQSKILQEKIIGDFITDNIITDKNELTSYTLNNEELIVNGVKQPEALHKKFKDKYVKNNNWSMMYNNSEEVK